MSTRSVIARTGKTEGEFAGVYSHWDGMPISRGPLLWKIVHEEFKGDLKAALVYLIDKHPAGWSSLDKRSCYCHPNRSKDPNHKGRKPEPANEFTHEHVVKGDTDIEWLYAFDEERNRLFVRDIGHDAETLIEMADAEPDWTEIECGGQKENWARCRHYARFHIKGLNSNLGMQTYLGNRPFDFHDAVAFVINGKRWASTGSGGHSDYYNRSMPGKSWPRNTWIASVKAKNGKRVDAAVARVVGHDYQPLPGIIWVMPPTAKNREETMVLA